MNTARRGLFRLLGGAAAAMAAPKPPLATSALTIGWSDATLITTGTIRCGAIAARSIQAGCHAADKIILPDVIRASDEWYEQLRHGLRPNLAHLSEPYRVVQSAQLLPATVPAAIGIAWCCPDGAAFEDLTA